MIDRQLRSADSSRPQRRSRLYTILILCHERSRFREVQLSRPVVHAAAILLVVLAVGGMLAPQLTLRTRRQADRLAKLETENRRLWEERQRFEGSLSEVQGQLAGFENRARRIADELGLEELDALGPASGGPSSGEGGRDWFDGELGSLRSRASSLDASFLEIDEAFERRSLELASTPSVMPVEGWFSHGYGWRNDPWTGEREFHYGVDIVAESGAAVRATADGVVSLADRSGNYGKVVEVAHGEGFVTRYAHLSELGVAPGRAIRRGDVIGRVGSTGRSTGPHLHYEVFRQGQRVNPGPYLGGH